MKTKYAICLVFSLLNLALFGQGSTGTLRGQIICDETGDPVPFAAVVAEQGARQYGAIAGEDGRFLIGGIQTGTYTVKVSAVGFVAQSIEGVKISSDKMTIFDRKLNMRMNDGPEIVFDRYKDELLGSGGCSTLKRLDAEIITSTAGPRDVGSLIASTVPRVYQQYEGGLLNFSGSRTGSALYIIDGVKVTGDPQVPQRGLEEIVVITGGIPAQYGDTTSGVVIITTKSF
jgi:hypothetical protein